MKNTDLKKHIYRNTYQNPSTGYVLTPSELSLKIIQYIPEYIFQSNITTFLDPICKGGSFLFEIVEKLFECGHSIKDIEKRIYTIDNNYHSLNLANSAIRQILRTKTDILPNILKYSFIDNCFNESIREISNNKIKTIEDFFNMLILDKKNYNIINMLNENAKLFIEKYEKISKKESKLFGEVFTSKKLIQEILDKLPKKIWRNKDLKWLDSSAGINNFFSEVIDRLMIGLSDEIKDDKERYKWIVEEMLYICELQTKNIFILYQLFDCNNEFNLNVFKGDFLSDEFLSQMKKWNIKEFDISLGNPPYNDISISEIKGGNQTSKKMWMHFIDRSMIISRYTLFVTPNNWLKDSCYLNKIFKSHLVSAEVDSNYIKRTFFPGVGSSFSYYILSKKPIEKSKIYVNNKLVDINFSSMSIFPTLNVSKESLSIFNKVLNKCNTTITFTRAKYDKILNINNVIYIERSRNDGFKKTENIDDIQNTPGESYWYESDKSDMLNNMLNNLNTKLYKFIIKNIKSGMAIVSTINSLPIYYEKKMTTDDLYSYFDLTKDEIKLIDDTIN